VHPLAEWRGPFAKSDEATLQRTLKHGPGGYQGLANQREFSMTENGHPATLSGVRTICRASGLLEHPLHPNARRRADELIHSAGLAFRP
jgi:hypothetical protein